MSGRRGLPLSFRCHVERQQTHGQLLDQQHVIKRTGRRRPYQSNKRGQKLMDAHEYICSCGHAGWSSHPGVLETPLMGRRLE